MFRIVDDSQLDERSERKRTREKGPGKRSSRVAHIVHDRSRETLIVWDKANSKKTTEREK